MINFSSTIIHARLNEKFRFMCHILRNPSYLDGLPKLNTRLICRLIFCNCKFLELRSHANYRSCRKFFDIIFQLSSIFVFFHRNNASLSVINYINLPYKILTLHWIGDEDSSLHYIIYIIMYRIHCSYSNVFSILFSVYSFVRRRNHGCERCKFSCMYIHNLDASKIMRNVNVYCLNFVYRPTIIFIRGWVFKEKKFIRGGGVAW